MWLNILYTFTGFTTRKVHSLQKFLVIQNAAPRVLTNTKRVEHIIQVPETLIHLPVCQRTDFEILLLVYKALNGLGPKYISNLHVQHEASRRPD